MGDAHASEPKLRPAAEVPSMSRVSALAAALPVSTFRVMADIRPFQRADLPAVLALLQRHMRGWKVDARLFSGPCLDHPWFDNELPSLVAVAPGNEIVGFTGVQVRRMRMDGRTILGVHSGHGVVKPESRAGGVGALLIGRALSGPQEITWSDGTADVVAAVFRTFGGQIDHVRTCDWLLVLRTTRWLRSLIAAATRSHRVSRREIPVPALPFQAAGHRIFPSAFPEPAVGVIGEDATAATIVEHLPALNKRRRLWVDYDEEYLDHLFDLVRSFRAWSPSEALSSPDSFAATTARLAGTRTLLALEGPAECFTCARSSERRTPFSASS